MREGVLWSVRMYGRDSFCSFWHSRLLELFPIFIEVSLKHGEIRLHIHIYIHTGIHVHIYRYVYFMYLNTHVDINFCVDLKDYLKEAALRAKGWSEA